MGSSVTESTSSDVLDLNNFDAYGRWSPYVLTSPRSLLACRKARTKPNELLYKSAADVARDLGVSIELAYPVYKEHEKIRQEKLEACRQERNKFINSLSLNGRKKKKKSCSRKDMGFYRNNIASNMRRTKSIQNKLDEDQKTVKSTTRKPKRRCRKSKSVSDLMNLKELCKKVDRIAILERYDPPDHKTVDNHKPMKKRTRPNTNVASRSLIDVSDSHIPDQDRKILENMRRKREEQQQCEALSQRVNLFWEQMREEEKRLTAEQKQKWQDFMMAKRNVENGVNQVRLEELRQAFENSQRRLEEQIRIRDEKVSELKRQILGRKEYENSMKRDTEARKLEMVNDNFFCEQMNTLARKKQLHDLSRLKQKNANETRNQSLQITKEKVMTHNRTEELRHAMQLERMQARHDNAIRRKFDECQAKERRAFQNHLDKMATRMRELANKSLQREQHMGQVHRVARELEDGMQRWQDRVMLMQYEQLRRAKENAALYTDNKRLRAEIENKRRALEHSAKMQRLKELERQRLCSIKKEIDDEEKKISRIKQKKNWEIQMSRKLASSTAELRNEIRRSTETFNPQS